MLALLKISGRIVWSALLSTPFALMITLVVDILTNQLNVRTDWLEEYEGWIGLAAFFLSLVACTHWVLRTHNRHLAISRGCGLFAVTVFVFLGVALVDLFLQPVLPDPVSALWLWVPFFTVIGIFVGAVAGMIAWEYRKRGQSP